MCTTGPTLVLYALFDSDSNIVIFLSKVFTNAPVIDRDEIYS